MIDKTFYYITVQKFQCFNVILIGAHFKFFVPPQKNLQISYYVINTCNFFASSQETPSNICDCGPEVILSALRFSLI